MASKHLRSFSLLTRLPLLLLAACAQLAGIGGADLPSEPANDAGVLPVPPPGVSYQDGSTPVDAGPDAPLPPSKTSCSANLDSDPKNCGYCTHRCLAGNACKGGVCDSDVVATATTLDSVALAPGGVLVGDATSGKIRICARTGPTDSCLVLASGAGIGSALGVVGAIQHFTYYDKQAGRVMACPLVGCSAGPRDLGVIDVGTANAPTFAADGEWVFWATPIAVTTSPVLDSAFTRQSDTRFVKTTRIAALYLPSEDSTTVAGTTTAGTWVLHLGDSDMPLADGQKRMITTTAANDVAVDTVLVWSAQNDGLFRAPHSNDAATKARDGAFTSVASSVGVAFAVTNGNVLRIQEGVPDATLATNATRVFADDLDDFVYFTRGNELRRVPR